MEVRAYAKINLTLEVLGRRDDEYHEVRTVLQTIDLADVLGFEKSALLEVESSDRSLDGESNLVWRAADLLRRATGYGGGARIHLEKHIPVGMGLGGGSSDAAATLVCLNNLWDLKLNFEALYELAASLGSDVPFFLTGGTCLGTGRGEHIASLPPPPEHWLVLLCPPPLSDVDSTSKTGKMYAMVRPEDFTDGRYTKQLVEALARDSFSGDLLFNGFEPVSRRAFPSAVEVEQAFLQAGAAKVGLAGSGPALYTLTRSENEAQAVFKSLKTRGLEAYCVSTVQPSLGWLGQAPERGGAKS